jgi:UDP-N-acetylmuramate dehydrogenase
MMAPSRKTAVSDGVFPPEFAARIRRDEPMARHTSFHVGGPADYFFEPRDRADLVAFLRAAPRDMPLLWIGLGSNLLVRDGGIRGAVIALHGAPGRLDRESQNIVFSEAGVPGARLAKQCIKWGLGAASWFAGIPGSLGGALAMNAGAYGGETWRHVRSVELIARDGTITTHDSAEFQVSYRHVEGPLAERWFLSARLHFDKSAVGDDQEMRALLQKRKDSQPIGSWNCGSVFTNPPGQYAAQLIETAGLKGLRAGGAEVSDKHANFIINEGQATAADIEGLIAQIQQTVEQRHGVRLRTEVRTVGDFRKA